MKDNTFLLLILIFLPSAILLAYLIINDIKKKARLNQLEYEKIKKQQEIEDAKQQLLETQKQIKEQILQMISNDFEKIRWSEWDSSIHQTIGQLDRIQRATDENNLIEVINYNPKNGYAKIQGATNKYYLTSHKGCSCPDFRERKIPCKHMYRLAIFIAGNEKINCNKNHNILEFCEDDLFYGFTFNITGKNQEPVRKIIIKHEGVFKPSLSRETTAVVTADNKKTSRIYEAKEKGIEIFTVNELETLFED